MLKESFGTWQLVNELESAGLLSSAESANLYSSIDFLWRGEYIPWEDVRGLFNFDVEPMNSANLCPTFTAVLLAIDEYRAMLNADISMQKRRRMYATVIKQVRESIAAQLRINPSALALVRNTTEANNILAGGFTRWDGGHVLLWNENHPTNNGAWKLRETGTRGIRHFSFPNPSTVTRSEVVETIVNAINASTRLLSFTEVSNVTGIRIPTQEVIAAVRTKARQLGVDIHIHIDGAQSWGSRDLDLTALDCDSFSASSHKWFMGPFETGILYMKGGRATQFAISYYGYSGDINIPEWNKLPTDASRFELLGQRDEANLYALQLTADIHNLIALDEHGIPDSARIEKRVAFLANELIARLKQSTKIQVRIISPDAQYMRHGVVVFRVFRGGREVAPEYIYQKLYEGDRKFATAFNHLGVRICPHIMSTPAQIQEIVEAVEAVSTKWEETEVEHQEAGATV